MQARRAQQFVDGDPAGDRAAVADRILDLLDELAQQAAAVLDGTAVGIGAAVHAVAQELVEQVAVGVMDLDAVEARLLGEARAADVFRDDAGHPDFEIAGGGTAACDLYNPAGGVARCAIYTCPIAAAGKVRLWKRATSLGGVESLIEHRASIEGAGSPCPPDLLRLSAGIEDIEDLYTDLDQAMR